MDELSALTATFTTNSFYGNNVTLANNRVAIASTSKVTFFENVSGDAWSKHSEISGLPFIKDINSFDDRVAVTLDNSVQVYDLSASASAWIEHANSPLSELSSVNYGNEVKFIDNDNILISDNFSDSIVIGGGTIYKYDISSSSTPTDQLTGYNLLKNDAFGTSLDVNSTYLIVGTPSKKVKQFNNVGNIVIYELSALTGPFAVLAPAPSAITPDLFFGDTISINASDNILVGTPNKRLKTKKGIGGAQLYAKVLGQPSWELSASLSENNELQSRYGNHVVLNDDNSAYVGEEGANYFKKNHGRIYFYPDASVTSASVNFELSSTIANNTYLGQNFEPLSGTDLIIGIPEFTSYGKVNHGLGFIIKGDGTNIIFSDDESLALTGTIISMA
jgi:hypothetical protein